VGVGVFEKRSSALALGGGVALAAGIGKEVYDATGHGHASERDLVWDVVGTVTGLALAFGVDWLIRGSLHEEKSDHSSSQPLFVSPGSMMIRF
jgi:putative lipoprotein